MDRAAVELSHVSFGYGHKYIYQDFSLTLGSGLYGLLGPNGAGKTTLMNLIATITKPSKGSVAVFGSSSSNWAGCRRIRSNVGYLPQRFQLMGSSSLLANVRYAAWVRGMSFSAAHRSALKAIGEVGLAESANTLVRSLSGGMRQRAGIACALVSNPRLLILDEPTVGLDPIQRITIRKLLDSYAQHATVLVSTHLVEDLAVIADHVIVVNQGDVLMQGTMDDLAARSDASDGLTTVWESGYRAILSARDGMAVEGSGAEASISNADLAVSMKS